MKSIPELFQDLLDIVTRKTRFYGFFPYSVTEDVVGRLSLKALTIVDNLPSTIMPDQLHINKAHGIPGTTTQLQKDHIVFLGFAGGDPGSPFVAFYPPNQPLPIMIQINATTEIRLGNPGSEARFISVAAITDGNFSTVYAKINALCTATGVPPLTSPFPSTATTKTVAE